MLQTLEQFNKFMKAVAYRMDSLRENQNNLDPDFQITPEMFISNLKADWMEAFVEATIKLYPHWVNNTVIGLDLDVKWKDKILPVRFITQNPKAKNKKDQRYYSEYAKLAQEGHVVVWVLRRSGEGTRAQCNYIGRIVDGVYTKLGAGREFKGNKVAPGAEDSMRDYVLELIKKLPNVSQSSVREVVEMAGKLGMLK